MHAMAAIFVLGERPRENTKDIHDCDFSYGRLPILLTNQSSRKKLKIEKESIINHYNTENDKKFEELSEEEQEAMKRDSQPLDCITCPRNRTRCKQRVCMFVQRY